MFEDEGFQSKRRTKGPNANFTAPMTDNFEVYLQESNSSLSLCSLHLLLIENEVTSKAHLLSGVCRYGNNDNLIVTTTSLIGKHLRFLS